MDLVFSTDDYAQAQRYAAWRDAICDVYVHVDVKAVDPDRYRGFIREAKFGDVVLTDILLSEQRIRRNNQHISQLDKDCYYIQLVHKGNISVLQRGETHRSNAARGAIFSATEQYELHGHGEVRSFYLELPRDEFAQRFPRERIPVSASLNTTQGLGRIATEFCASLATEGSKLDDGVARRPRRPADGHAGLHAADVGRRHAGGRRLGEEGPPAVGPAVDRGAHRGPRPLAREGRRRATACRCATCIVLFEACEMSVSEWIWNRRLQLAYDGLARGDGRSITSIAFDHGFNSSAHFSTMFRRRMRGGAARRQSLRRWRLSVPS